MSDKYIETIDTGSAFLAHYGIKGMKWDASKKKSPAELLAAELKRKRKEAILKKAVNAGTSYARNKAHDALIDRLSASVARATTPHPSSPDNQRKTSQSPYRGRDLEEAARRTESEKRNQGVKKTKKKSSLSAAKEKAKEMAINANWEKVYEEQRKQEAENAAAAKKRRMAEARAMEKEKARREENHRARLAAEKSAREGKVEAEKIRTRANDAERERENAKRFKEQEARAEREKRDRDMEWNAKMNSEEARNYRKTQAAREKNRQQSGLKEYIRKKTIETKKRNQFLKKQKADAKAKAIKGALAGSTATAARRKTKPWY